MLQKLKAVTDILLGRNPDLPHNDSVVGLFLSTVAFTITAIFLHSWIALGHPWGDPLVGAAFAALYGLVVTCYSVAVGLSYRYRTYLERRLEEQIANATREHDELVTPDAICFAEQQLADLEVQKRTRPTSRWGEHVAAAFITFSFLLPSLVAFGVRIPRIGTFSYSPETLVIMSGTTIAVLVASSGVKIFSVPNRPRIEHNKVLLRLCYIATAAVMILILREGLGGPTVSLNVLGLYDGLLIGYAAHNTVLSLMCPAIRLRNLGHLAGIAVIAIFTPTLFVLVEFDLLRFSMAVVPFCIFTALTLLLSVGAKYNKPLRKWARRHRRKKNDDNGTSQNHGGSMLQYLDESG